MRKRYPKADIWTTGHSLGGTIASLISMAHGVPAVTFESAGDLHIAKRLGLVPNEPDVSKLMDKLSIFHIGHIHDSIFMGTCGGSLSLCSLDGFVLETFCQSGKVCIYDERTYLGQRRREGRKSAPRSKLTPKESVLYHGVYFFQILLDNDDDALTSFMNRLII